MAGTSGYRWILDPIDGTKPFIYGVPLFGTLIGIEFEGRMVAGVCRFPAQDEVVYAEEGTGAWWKIGDAPATQATVSTESDLSRARLMFTEPTHDVRVGRSDVLPGFLQKVRIARGWGDCYGHMMVATGRAELAIDPEMSAVGHCRADSHCAGSRWSLHRLAGGRKHPRSGRLLDECSAACRSPGDPQSCAPPSPNNRLHASPGVASIHLRNNSCRILALPNWRKHLWATAAS